MSHYCILVTCFPSGNPRIGGRGAALATPVVIAGPRIPQVSGELLNIAPGVYVWLRNRSVYSDTNSGIVVANDGLTVLDAGPSPESATPLAQRLAALTELPVRRLVFSGSHIDVTGGGTAFPLAAVYGRAQTSDHLDQPPNPDVWQRLHPEHDFTDVSTRPVTHTVEEAAYLCPASIAVPATGPQFESLVVQVPSANVVFAGLVASFGVVPLGYEADFPRWIETLETMTEWGEIIVPAHGPVGGAEEITTLRNYLEAVLDAKGDTGSLADGPWTSWDHPEFSAVNVERAHLLAQGDPSPPPSLLRLLGINHD